MPVYCYLCGVVGHLEKKCPLRYQEDFIDPGAEFPFGEWLKAATTGPQGSGGRTVMGNGLLGTQTLGAQERVRGARSLEGAARGTRSSGNIGIGFNDENEPMMGSMSV